MKKENQTAKSYVANFYVSVRDGEFSSAYWLKNKTIFELGVVSLEDIDPNRFAFRAEYDSHTDVTKRVKYTTILRYLRKFRAIDRRNLKNERPLASVSELVAKA